MLPSINTFSPIHYIQLVVKYVWFARKKKIFMLRLFCNLLLSFANSCNLLLSSSSIGCPLVQSAIECWVYWLPTSALNMYLKGLPTLYLGSFHFRVAWSIVTFSTTRGLSGLAGDLVKNKNYISFFPSCSIQFRIQWIFNKRPTGLNGHLSIRDFTLTSCQKGSYLYINNPIIE